MRRLTMKAMSVLVMIIVLLISVGCNSPVVTTPDRFPMYPVVERSSEKITIPAEVMNPFRVTAYSGLKKLDSLYRDPNINEETKEMIRIKIEEIASELVKTENDAKEATKIISGHIEDLIKWGNKNQSTVESYRKYAKEHNSKVDNYEKLDEEE